MENNSKKIEVTLDSRSIEVLKKVDPLHRDSVINVALQLIKNTGYYKTLAGTNSTSELDDVVSLDNLDDLDKSSKTSSNKTVKETTETSKPKPKSTSWDAF
jgi:hypothetical protein